MQYMKLSASIKESQNIRIYPNKDLLKRNILCVEEK